jgi:hypothetical protein
MSADLWANEATPEEFILRSEEWHKTHWPYQDDQSRAGTLRVALTYAVQELNQLRRELAEKEAGESL